MRNVGTRNTITKIDPYTAREVRFHKEASFEGWRLKVYGISTGKEPVSDDLVEIGLNAVLPKLPLPALSENCYGVGFLIIHRGALRNWFSLDWWEYEDILFHSLYSSPLEAPNAISKEESAAIACVHELKIIGFESEAWIKSVLSNNGGPDFENYLAEMHI